MKRKVFIDTSEFIANNFDYKNSKFEAILKRVSYGQIILGLPTVTKREIEERIKISVAESLQSLTKIRSDVKILRTLGSSEFSGLFSPPNQEQLCLDLIGNLESYLTDCKTEIIPLAEVDAQRIFELYFECKPPFKDGKKKYEFPDAFSLAALGNWGGFDKSEVLIASSDSDMESGCQNFPFLTYVGGLEKLLEILANEFDEFLADKAEQACNTLHSQIEESLSSEFADLEYYLEGEDGEVNNVSIGEISLDVSLIEVSESDEGEGEAIFEAVGNFSFTAEISYADMETAVYDREDGRYYIWNSIDETTEEEQDFKAFVKITFDIEHPEACDIVDIETETTHVIGVSTNEAKEWPYK